MSFDGVEVDAMTSALARAHETHGVVVTRSITSDLACATRVLIDGVARVTLWRTLFDQLAHGTDDFPETRGRRHRDGSQVPVVLEGLTYVGVASMAWRRRLRRGGAPQLLCGVYRAGQCNK